MESRYLSGKTSPRRPIAAAKQPVFALLFALIMNGSAAYANSPMWLYSVKPGDSIWNICQKYTNKQGCWQQLPDQNGVSRSRQLPPGFVVRIPVGWLKNSPQPATITFISGEVFIHSVSAKQPAENLQAKANQKLYIGDAIETRNGYANLTLADGSILNLEPQSKLILDAFSTVNGNVIADSQMRLTRGAVRATVKKRSPKSRFKITTPAAVAAVRGTQYRVSADPGSESSQTRATMRAEVLHGLIDVSNKATAENVPAGFGIQAKAGETIQPPVKLLPAPQFVSSDDPLLVPGKIQWKALSGAVSYRVVLLENTDVRQVKRSEEVSQTSVLVNDLKDGCYLIEVRAIDKFGLEGLASTRAMCVTEPVTPTQINTRLKYIDTHVVEISWKEIPDVRAYYFELASDSSFENIIFKGTIPETQLKWNTQSPVYLRVQSVNYSGRRSEFCEPMKIKAQTKRKAWGF